MAFRDDEAALHARNEQLERELDDAQTQARELRGVAAERDRLKAQLDALQPPKRPRERPTPQGEPRARPPVNRAPIVMAVLGLVVLVAAGALVYVMTSGAPMSATQGIFGTGSSIAASENKAGDARPPTLGVVDLSATPDPAPIPFTVTGTDQAPSPCRGYLPSAPQLVLRTTHATLVRITTRCNVDLVALLTGAPAGLLCDDDSGGSMQPLLSTTLPAGDTRLVIGTFSEGVSASCEIELHADALPDGVDAHGLATTSEPTVATLALDGAPAVGSGHAGHVGTTLIEAARVQSGCVGFLSSVPDLVVNVTEPTIVRVDATSADADLVLVMGAPDGSYTCDDDDGVGNAPRVAKRVGPGRYPIWVGTFHSLPPGTAFNAGVQLTTIASEASTPVPSMDLAVGPAVHVTGTSGDELSAASMWSDCAVAGYVPYEPTQTFRLAARSDVTVTSSRGDLLLAVTPDAHRTATVRSCTTEPSWRATLDAGTYALYVGVASGETLRGAFDLTLQVSAPSVLPYSP